MMDPNEGWKRNMLELHRQMNPPAWCCGISMLLSFGAILVILICYSIRTLR